MNFPGGHINVSIQVCSKEVFGSISEKKNDLLSEIQSIDGRAEDGKSEEED